MQKWKNKAGVRLSALDKKKLVLTNLPYVLTAFYADRASCLYRSSPGEDKRKEEGTEKLVQVQNLITG